MINVKDYLAKQLSGPIIDTVFQGVSWGFNKPVDYLEYAATISIDSAVDQDIEEIGKLIGFIRPLIPNEVILEGLFRFSSYISAPTFSATGFSDVTGSVDGGNFSQLGLVLDSNLMPLSYYKKVLKSIAKIKWSKLSMLAIDEVCNLLGAGYVVTYHANHDIIITFSDISLTNLYLASMVFDATFNTLPRIICARS
jgi:hypothetical protein